MNKPDTGRGAGFDILKGVVAGFFASLMLRIMFGWDMIFKEKVTGIHATDIMNKIGSIGVSGNEEAPKSCTSCP